MVDDLRRTVLFERQRGLGARFVPFAGWEMPVQYSAGVKQEHLAVRQGAGLFDVSHMGELWITGDGAVAAVDRLVTNDVGATPVGRALYTVACNASGGILDDLIIYRIDDTTVLVVCNASNREKISSHFAREIGAGARFEDRSDEFCLLALQGPKSEAIASALDAPAATALARFGVARGNAAGVSIIAARTGYTGEDGFELFCRPEDAVTLWDAIVEAGAKHGLLPIGLGARDTLRLEARLMLYGNDIDETTNPYEAGLGWTVKLRKGDFLGREALQAVKRSGVERKLVGLAMVGRGIARPGYPIRDAAGEAVGRVTSGGPGLSIGKNIALGYVPRALAAEGTQLGIEIRDKVIEAEVVETPFYKRASPNS